MSYTASVLNVMIASPNDVAKERQITRDTIHEWNSIHSMDRQIVLMPVGWESDTWPSMEGRPQAVISKQILRDADLLIGIFWSRVGSPTGKSDSGTIEEIEEHLDAGKPAMLYFSTEPIHQGKLETEQFDKLQKFKEECKERGLIVEYDSKSQFKESLTRQLAQKVIGEFSNNTDTNEPERIVAAAGAGVETDDEMIERLSIPDLSYESKQLLVEASEDRGGIVMLLRSLGGTQLQSNGKSFMDQRNPKSVALWTDVLNTLVDFELLEDRGDKGEVYGVTHRGYEVAEIVRGQL